MFGALVEVTFGTAPPVLKIGQTCVGTVPPSLLWSTPLGGAGRLGEGGGMWTPSMCCR